MAGILIIAHAPLATALRECIAHIYGGLPARIGVVDVASDSDPLELIGLARSEISRLTEQNGVLVLTDLFGATPSNIAAQLATIPSVRVVSGINLPMLVRAVCYRTTPLDTLVDKVLAGGAKGIQAVVGPSTNVPLTASPCDEPFPGVPATQSSPTAPCLPEHHAATRNHHRK